MADSPSPSIRDNPFKVPSSAIQEVRETTGAAPPTTTAPEKKKGYTYSSLPSLTGGPKRKIYKQPKKR